METKKCKTCRTYNTCPAKGELCNDYVEVEEPHKWIPMPKEWIGMIYNACTEPCDMLYGACACGATHHLDEWIIKRKKLTNQGWVDPDCKNYEKQN